MYRRNSGELAVYEEIETDNARWAFESVLHYRQGVDGDAAVSLSLLIAYVKKQSRKLVYLDEGVPWFLWEPKTFKSFANWNNERITEICDCLEKKKLIKIRMQGIPPRRFVQLDYKRILELLIAGKPTKAYKERLLVLQAEDEVKGSA